MVPLGQLRGLPLPLLPEGPKPGEAGHTFVGMVLAAVVLCPLQTGCPAAWRAKRQARQETRQQRMPPKGATVTQKENGRGSLPLPLYFLPSWEDPRPAVRCRRPDAGEERPGVVREIPPVPAFR